MQLTALLLNTLAHEQTKIAKYRYAATHEAMPASAAILSVYAMAKHGKSAVYLREALKAAALPQ